MDASKIAELASQSGISAEDREGLVSFTLGFADGVRNADSAEPVHIYGAIISANVIPVLAFVRAAGIPHEYHEIDLMKGATRTPEFLSMNPYHTVPTIKHGDFSLHESSSILRYLVKAFPTASAKFYGSGNIHSQALIDCAMDERNCGIYSKVAALLYPFLGFAPKPTDEATASAISQLHERLEVFAERFLSSTPFVGGDHPSLAEFSVAPLVLGSAGSFYYDKAFPEKIKAWAASFETATPAILDVRDGTKNGVGMGALQFAVMRAGTYADTAVGAVNGM